MPIFRFESREKKCDREMQEIADIIAREVAKNKYDPDHDTVLVDFRKKMGLPHPQKK